MPSLRSFEIAIRQAESEGLSVQAFYYLDSPDERTRLLFEAYALDVGLIHEVDFADQGKVRNTAVAEATGEYIAFLDADDLWSRSWLVDAVAFLREEPVRSIAHPAYNYFFESLATIFCHQDQDAAVFDLDLLRVANYWDALCVCKTEIYREFPFGARDIEAGWAYEDWLWNCETLAAGIRHRTVPDTVLFKRRQRISQTIRASTNKSRIRNNVLSRYDSPHYFDDSGGA